MKKELHRFRMFHEAERVREGAVGSALPQTLPMKTVWSTRRVRIGESKKGGFGSRISEAAS
jgi:hypothetical protein